MQKLRNAVAEIDRLRLANADCSDQRYQLSNADYERSNVAYVHSNFDYADGNADYDARQLAGAVADVHSLRESVPIALRDSRTDDALATAQRTLADLSAARAAAAKRAAKLDEDHPETEPEQTVHRLNAQEWELKLLNELRVLFKSNNKS